MSVSLSCKVASDVMTSDVVGRCGSATVGVSGRVGGGGAHSGTGAVGSMLTQLVKSTRQAKFCNRYTFATNSHNDDQVSKYSPTQVEIVQNFATFLMPLINLETDNYFVLMNR